jgi:hypothetical protein
VFLLVCFAAFMSSFLKAFGCSFFGLLVPVCCLYTFCMQLPGLSLTCNPFVGTVLGFATTTTTVCAASSSSLQP